MKNIWVSEPHQFKERWAFVTLENPEELRASQIPLHISITFSPLDSLKGKDLEVSLLAGPSNQALEAIEQPDCDSPLGTVRTKAITGYAHYIFHNPSNMEPHTLILNLEGEPKSFDLKGPGEILSYNIRE